MAIFLHQCVAISASGVLRQSSGLEATTARTGFLIPLTMAQNDVLSHSGGDGTEEISKTDQLGETAISPVSNPSSRILRPGMVVSLMADNGKYCDSHAEDVKPASHCTTDTEVKFDVLDAGSGYVALAASNGAYSDSKLGLEQHEQAKMKAEDVTATDKSTEVILKSKFYDGYCAVKKSFVCDVLSRNEAPKFKVRCLSGCQENKNDAKIDARGWITWRGTAEAGQKCSSPCQAGPPPSGSSLGHVRNWMPAKRNKNCEQSCKEESADMKCAGSKYGEGKTTKTSTSCIKATQSETKDLRCMCYNPKVDHRESPVAAWCYVGKNKQLWGEVPAPP